MPCRNSPFVSRKDADRATWSGQYPVARNRAEAIFRAFAAGTAIGEREASNNYFVMVIPEQTRCWIQATNKAQSGGTKLVERTIHRASCDLQSQFPIGGPGLPTRRSLERPPPPLVVEPGPDLLEVALEGAPGLAVAGHRCGRTRSITPARTSSLSWPSPPPRSTPASTAEAT